MERLIQRLSEARDVTPAQAADEVEKLIWKIRKKLRHGEAARVPGLGTFKPGPGRTEFRLEESRAGR